jgi:hypothetical protein
MKETYSMSSPMELAAFGLLAGVTLLLAAEESPVFAAGEAAAGVAESMVGSAPSSASTRAFAE